MGNQRAGYALILSVLGVVFAGALVVATHAIVSIEHIAASSAIHRQRAFAASEHALWTSVAGLAVADPGIEPGGWTKRTVVAGGDSATVITVRLSQAIYWLAADARVSDGTFRARRRTGTNVRVDGDSSGRRVRRVSRAWVEVH